MGLSQKTKSINRQGLKVFAKQAKL